MVLCTVLQDKVPYKINIIATKFCILYNYVLFAVVYNNITCVIW